MHLCLKGYMAVVGARWVSAAEPNHKEQPLPIFAFSDRICPADLALQDEAAASIVVPAQAGVVP
jgi:hypothetical protein